MVDAHQPMVFLAAALLLALVPGPGMFYVAARTLAAGRSELDVGEYFSLSQKPPATRPEA